MLKFKKALSICLSFVILMNLSVFFVSADVTCVDRGSDEVDIYRKNENDYMKIALTFDDGPHPRYTKEILEILDEYDIKATFFVIGINVKYYPETMNSIIEHGHEIGNHTYTHPHVRDLDCIKLKTEIEDCEDMVCNLGEYHTKLFRPPEGMIGGEVKNAVKDLGYKVILWDIDTRDWAHTPPKDIAQNVISNVKSGDIILMHDYIAYNSPTPEALRLFIPTLLEKGYKFVVISELIGLD